MKNIFKTFFASQAAHHAVAARAHHDMAEQCEDGATKNFHQKMKDSHVRTGEDCAECVKGVDIDTHDDSRGVPGRKAMDSGGMFAARELDKMMPTAVHAVIPDNPMAKSRLVPRPGQDLMVPTDPGEDATQVLDKAMGRV